MQDITLDEKLEFLRRPEAFPDAPERVDIVETHFAWVFLSRRFVYKLKKPLKFHVFDFTTLEARRENCELEIALNRRLAEPVYIGVVPLGRHDAKMHRLPTERTLEYAATHAGVEATDLAALIEKLARFYAATSRAPWDGPSYRHILAQRLEGYAAELTATDLPFDPGRIRRIVDAGLKFVREQPELLEARIAAGRVVDAHGDLRPEHVFLGPEPQIIDCLEFSADLRLLDTLEEIQFLALECERLGRSDIGRRIEQLYRQRCSDDGAGVLAGFYRSQRAIVRALLCAWHLHDGLSVGVEQHWRERANWYLDAAAAAIDAGTAAPRAAGLVS